MQIPSLSQTVTDAVLGASKSEGFLQVEDSGCWWIVRGIAWRAVWGAVDVEVFDVCDGEIDFEHSAVRGFLREVEV